MAVVCFFCIEMILPRWTEWFPMNVQVAKITTQLRARMIVVKYLNGLRFVMAKR